MTKGILVTIFLQWSHLPLSCQGTCVSFEKAWTIRRESFSIQSLDHVLSIAISIALKTTKNYACKELEIEIGLEKSRIKFSGWYLKIPPQPLI